MSDLVSPGNHPPPLDDFFTALATRNPFLDNRVNGPLTSDATVPAIHQREFERLIALAGDARQASQGIGVVVWGEAGIGKSHLLARLTDWAEQEKNGCLIYLHNLQSTPAALPRSILRAVLSTLTRGPMAAWDETLLFRLANAFVREALAATPEQTYTYAQAQYAVDRLVNALRARSAAAAVLHDPAIYHVLFQFFLAAYQAARQESTDRLARLAIRRLAGDSLDPDETRAVGVRPAGDETLPALADAQEIKKVLVAVCRMAASRHQPIILCFDQVDNLEPDQAAALGRFLEAVLDSTGNLLTVVAGVKATLMQWRAQKVIQDSAWDRLGQFEIDLHRVSPNDARRILTARLHAFLRPFAELPEVRSARASDPSFPLGEAWVRRTLDNKAEVRPRDFINFAREAWRRLQEALAMRGGPAWLAQWQVAPAEPLATGLLDPQQLREAIDCKVAEKLGEFRALRGAMPESLPPDAENLAGLFRALLRDALPHVAPTWALEEAASLATGGGRPFVDFLIRETSAGKTGQLRRGVLVWTSGSAQSTTAALRRLEQAVGELDQVVLITDERLPLPRGRVGQQIYEQLLEQGPSRFRHLELRMADQIDLDVLVSVAGLARAGDLELLLPGGVSRPLSEEEVKDSLHRQGRYAKAPFLRVLLDYDPASASSEPLAIETA